VCAGDDFAIVPLEALVGHVETDLGGFYRDAGVEPAVGDVRQEREVRVGVGARVGGIVVVLAEQVQDDGDAVLVARSGVFDGFRALSPATNRRAMGGIIRSTRGGSDFIVVDPDGFGTGR